MDKENKSITIVVFGGTGDLIKRKLVPAFSNLLKSGTLGGESRIIGIGRKDFSLEEYKKFLANGDNKLIINIEEMSIFYFKAEISQKNGLKELKVFLDNIENGEETNRIFYLATSYQFFPNIVNELKALGLNEQNNGFSRIAFEKPFGFSLESSDELDERIKCVFPEERIFRIDHYLAKEVVQSIIKLKLNNKDFNNVLSNKFIESIKIIVDEELGVENRLNYYNNVGAIKDVIQSHLLQVLALLLMDVPDSLDADKIHNEKVKVLQAIDIGNINESFIGQYKSYTNECKEAGLNLGKTETFSKIFLECKNERWEGVKIILQTGKKLARKRGQISINLKDKNKIIIGIYPKQDFKILINNGNSEHVNELKKLDLDAFKTKYFMPNTPDEYATLLNEIIKGDKMLFSRYDEIQESWRIVEKIESFKDKMRFVVYEDGQEPEKGL